MNNTALSAKKNYLSVQTVNSSCQLAIFWVNGSMNPQGFGSVAPKGSREIAAFGE